LNAPKYLLHKDFLIGSVAFVVIFSLLFLLLYHPFSDTVWLSTDPEGTLLPSILFYMVGILILLGSKFLMMLYQIRRSFTVGRLLLWLFGEFVLIALAYLLFTSHYIGAEVSFSAKVILRTSYCVGLILAIPYAIFALIAGNLAKAEEINILKLNKEADIPSPSSPIIDFYDYTGALKISVASDSIYYIGSQDNYVEIRYELDGKLLNYLMRCRTTRLEKQLEGTSLIRCHRSFIVNIDNVSQFKRENARAFLVLSHPDAKKIPVSKSYYKAIAERLGRIAS
jgi:hypothetical protein